MDESEINEFPALSEDRTQDHEQHHSTLPTAHDGHAETGGIVGRLGHLLGTHAHGQPASAQDPALSTERGIWALKVSLIGLLLTALFQVGIVAISGSVALLADTIHNFSDALTALPLWLAFTLAKRARNRRYTYGYGRAEDLAGALIVVMIFLSALIVFYESIVKIANPQPLAHLGWVAAAAIIGFLGNELVALFRIRVGRAINSAALIADGLHSRADGFTSLGVLLGAIGVGLGFPLADPLIGFAIGIAILAISGGAAREMWYRLMDAVDPKLCEAIEQTVAGVPGVRDVHEVAVRWVGHRQRTELHIRVDGQLPTWESHRIAEAVRHALFHALPALVEVTVHIDPIEPEAGDAHQATDHHRAA
ncbi:MAG TPA: cation diffusion facilitator family transporter [Anaerolineae bacterium]|nr:cation diffusion facilitator family transporter [Anaerolineae bacterium]